MKLKQFLLVFIFLFSTFRILHAQEASVRGVIYNGNTNETIPGVSVLTSEKTGIISEIDGSYSVKVHPGKAVKLVFKLLGYGNVTKLFEIKTGETKIIDIYMFEKSTAIEGVVVSAGKFEQKLTDVTVSMDVIKPSRIENQNTNNIMSALNKVSGVEIYDSQPSIRGGSGYSYGAGSRVQILVDDMPMLSPDAADTKWNYLPIENLSQVEVIKGASSALFGSSALSGVINLRTAYPKDKPETKIIINTGLYLNPKRIETAWWYDENLPYKYEQTVLAKIVNPASLFGVKNPGFGGASFFHSRKIGQLDLVVGGNLYENQSFRYGDGEARARANVNLRYRIKKIEGLSFGLNTNYMMQDKANFFLWTNGDDGIYKQSNAPVANIGHRFNLDPYLLFFNKRGSKYSLKLRYYMQTNHDKADSTKDNDSQVIYADYQYQHLFKKKYNLTAGISGNYSQSTALLYQTSHHGLNGAIYAQFDAKFWEKLSISIGIRGEYFRIDKDESESSFSIKTKKDTIEIPIEPVFRAGINYQPAEYTFIRASFGQGYRFPSIAEKYIKTSIGGLNIFPNTKLRPESGWSAELGIKQGYKIGTWLGFLDVAGFYTQYKNMMEFTFGVYKPDTAQYATLNDIGFKSLNVGHALVCGVDANITGKGLIFSFPASFIIGYTYMYPIDLDYDASDTATTEIDKFLKYRYQHSVKADFEIEIHFFTLGVAYNYCSNIIRVDKAFEEPLIPGLSSTQLLPGFKEYRDKNNKGYHLIDLRLLFNISKQHRIGVFLNNILNQEYMTRPGFVEAPINIAIQYTLGF
ncbi:MAG: TonB-dependent receptor [Bacteroidales bacterium]|jgi:iron complex outermembrane receptor protein|nr:TonB-dependent receptor [Bacteroidales bacterium]MDD4213528.1 TonB-dependent receptor [Bacteroidales bacterium]